MRSTLLFGVALFTLLLSGCESEAEDAIVVDLLAIEYANPGNSETACRVSYVVRNNTQNRLNRLWLTLSWSEESEANENKSNAQIAVKDVPPKGKWKAGWVKYGIRCVKYGNFHRWPLRGAISVLYTPP